MASQSARSSALPESVAAGWRAYLRPLEREAQGSLELILRQGARVERRPVERDVLVPWSRNQSPVVAARIGALLENLDRPRPPRFVHEPGCPLVMGILNVTPDSFSDGGDHGTTDAAIAHGQGLITEGATIIDVGGESTRPGASAPSLDIELERVLPVIAALAPSAAAISIDTRRAAVMRAALETGATMINDVSALTFDAESLGFAASTDIPVVLMHMQGTPETMQRAPRYEAAPFDVFDVLEARVAACEAAGIARERLIVDPGVGFGKALEHNLDVLRHLALYRALGCAVMVGASRKGFIGQLTGTRSPKERLAGSLAAALFAADQGVDILRVHDVAATLQALKVHAAIGQTARPTSGSGRVAPARA